MNKHIIYGLIDPETKELRYIGYTSSPQKRYYNHYYHKFLKNKTHKNNWLNSLLAKGQKAEMIILEEYQTAEELPQAEIEMIAYYKYIGCDLVNGTEGGDGGSVKGRKLSENAKINMSLGQKGKIISQETKNKMSKSHIGRCATKGTTGLKYSEETRQKMRDAWKKRKATNNVILIQASQ